MNTMQRNETRAPGAEFDGPSQMRDTVHPPKRVTDSYCKATDRAMLRLCGVLRRIVDQNLEEQERAA